MDANQTLLTDDPVDDDVVHIGSSDSMPIQELVVVVRDGVVPGLGIEYESARSTRMVRRSLAS